MKTKNHKIILLLLPSVIFSGLNAQSFQRFSANAPSDTNFFQITNHFYENYPGYGEDTSEAGNFTQFKRWENFWAPRVGATGSFKIAAQATQNYVDNYNPGDKISSVASDWDELGPFGSIAAGPPVGSANGVGRIGAIAFDPGYNGTTNQIMYAAGPNSGVWKLDLNVSNQWANLNTDQQMARIGVSSIAVDPIPNIGNNYIYAATGDFDGGFLSNGIYRSIDNGLTWQTINIGLPSPSSVQYIIGKLLIDPSNDSIMYAATSDGIFQTNNRQASSPTWFKIYSGPSGSELVANILFDPTDNTYQTLYAAGIDIIKTTDGGINWSYIARGNGLDLTGTPLPSAGSTLAPVQQYCPNCNCTMTNDNYVNRINISISADGAYLYAGIVTTFGSFISWATCASNYFFQFNTSTQQWMPKASYYAQTYQYGGPTPTRMAYQVSPINNQRIYTGGVRIVNTNNGGSNWNAISSCPHDDYHAMEFPPNDPNTLFVGTDGGVWKLILDAGGNVINCTPLNDNLGVATLYYSSSSPFDEHQILAGMQDVGVNYLKGQQWTHVWHNDGFESVMDYSDINTMYSVKGPGPNGCVGVSAPSVTGGTASAPIFTGCIKQDGYFGAPIALDPINPDIIYFGGFDLWKSTSGSSTSTGSWTKISDFPTYILLVSATYRIIISPSDPNVIYVVFAFDTNNPASFDGKIAKTMIGGGTDSSDWINISPSPTNPSGNPLGNPITGLAVSSTDPNHIWISYSGYDGTFVNKVQESVDGGVTWTSVSWVNNTTSASLPNVPVNCIVYEKGSDDGIYIGTDIGVYYHNNSMTGWEPFMTDLPNVIVSNLEINYKSNSILAATFGRGMWESHLACPQITNLPLEGNLQGFYEAKENITITTHPTLFTTNTGDLKVRAGNEIHVVTSFPGPSSEYIRFLPNTHLFIHGCDSAHPNSFKQAPANNNPSVQTDNALIADRPMTETEDFKFTYYPNPFTDHLHIEFLLEKNSPVLVSIYNPQGQLIESLANRTYEAGAHIVEFNNSSLKPGLYFVRLDIGNKHYAKAVIKSAE